MGNLKDFFYYTRGERNGVLTLLAALLILFFLPYSYAFFIEKETLGFDEFKEDVLAFEAGLSERKQKMERQRSAYAGKTTNYTQKKEVKLDPIPFDPNNVSGAELEAMGLPKHSIKSILNYRSKGGYFKTKESLQKIYTLSDKHYQQLYDYIELEKAADQQPSEELEQPETPTVLPEPFDFDPNTATGEVFERLGLNTATTRSILNYREKGGRFYKKEDFKKIYTLDEATYAHLEANIKIVAQPKLDKKASYTPKSYYKIDINQASLEDFQQFRGIGPSYAKRILKMKEGLGGFISTNQIGELYKLPDSTFQAMLPYLECGPLEIQKININTASLDELKAHPYLRWFHAKAIIKYRETEGPWKSVELVQILTEFDDGKGTYAKVKPYLTVE